MKNYILYLVLLFTIKSGAQKSTIYLDDSLNVISKLEFKKPLKQYESITSIVFDSVKAKVKFNKTYEGKLSDEEHKHLKEELISGSNIAILNDDIIVINYYPGKDKCNSSGNRDFVKNRYQDYNSQISKLKYVKQFFVYKELKGIENYGNLNWLADPNKLIESTFFKIHYPCGSYVIINKDGTYFSYRGEYNLSSILLAIKK